LFNFRYHVASLVAVFLALAVGLLLGTVVAERVDLQGQGTRIVDSLNTTFSGLRKENVELKRDRDRDRAFAWDTLPLLTDRLLAGKRILVVTNAGRTDALAPVEEGLRAAGADVVVVTFRDPGLGLEDAKVASAVSAVVTPTPVSTMSPDPVVAALANEWVRRGQEETMAATLASAGELTVDGSLGDVAADGIVMLASWDGQGDPALVSLASRIQRVGVPAVAAETQGQQTGVVGAALGAGLSTVDHVDLPEGRLSLVYVLAGKAEGHFGVKQGSNAAYPALR
jgi:hypothetical protein